MNRRGFVTLAGALAVPPLRLSPVRPHVVIIFLRGGADGLSIVVPHGDARYYAARPRGAVPSRDALDLDGYFGLAPALAPLKSWWDNGSLALAPAAGFASRLRGHAEAQARLDRWLAGAGARPVASLAAAAHRIRGGGEPRCLTVSSTGWDAHTSLAADTTALRLRALAADVAAFLRAVGDRARNVVVVTVSEFGRSIRQNAWGGTGHGSATALLALGGPVTGRRVWGHWPGLDGVDVPVTAEIPALLARLAAAHTVA